MDRGKVLQQKLGTLIFLLTHLFSSQSAVQNCVSQNMGFGQDCKCCKNEYFLYNNQCYNGQLNCPDQTYASVMTSSPSQQCTNSDSKLYICVDCATTVTSCLACTVNTVASSSSQTVTCSCCSDGYYLYPSTNICYNGATSCPTNTFASVMASSPSTSCTTLSSQLYFCKDCNTVITSCAACSVDNVAASGYIVTCNCCSSPQFLYLNTCISTCPDGTYGSIATTYGTRCSDGNTDNKICLTCSSAVSNCLACTVNVIASTDQTVTCLCCQNGYYLYGGACYLGSANCPINTYPSVIVTPDAQCTNLASQNYNCLTCTSSKTDCGGCSVDIIQSTGQTTTCTCCLSNFYLYNQVCYSGSSNCPAGTFASIDTAYATRCSAVNTNKEVCKTCTSAISNCAICAVDTIASSGYTVTCKCCEIGYFLYNNQCHNGQANCPSDTYPSIMSSAPVAACVVALTSLQYCLTCASAITNCAICTVDAVASSGSTVTCKCCDIGYFLYNNQCYNGQANCPSITFATIMSSAPVANCVAAVTSLQQCLTCASAITNCAVCAVDSVASSGYTVTCKCCDIGYFLFNNLCYNGQPNCPSNTFASIMPSAPVASCVVAVTSLQQCLTCASAIPNCAVCSVDAVASSGYIVTCQCCNSGYALQGNSCVSSCPIGTYIDWDVSLSCLNKNICRSCSVIPNCNQCRLSASVVICECCSSGYFLLNNQCINSCYDYTYQKVLTPGCISCNLCRDSAPHCDQCLLTNAFLNIVNCQCCETGYYLYQGQCLSSIVNGTYPSVNALTCSNQNILLDCNLQLPNCTYCTTYQGQLVCQNCQPDCEYCLGYNSCVKCRKGQLSANQTCQITNCNFMCDQCDSILEFDKCTSCGEGRELFGGVCQCEDGKTENSKGRCVKSQKVSKIVVQQSLLISATIGTFISIVNGKPFLLLRLLDTSQQLSNINYIKTPFFKENQEILEILDHSNLPDKFSNVYQLWGEKLGILIKENNTLFTQNTSDISKFSKFRLNQKTSSFMANGANILLLTGFSWVLVLIIRVSIRKFKTNKLKKVAHFFDRNYVVQQFYMTFGEQALYMILFVQNFKLDQLFYIVDVAAMGVFIIYDVYMLFSIYKSIQGVDYKEGVNLTKLEDEQNSDGQLDLTKSSYSSVQEHIKQSEYHLQNKQRYWFLVSLAKKTAISIIVAGVYQQAQLQCVFLAVVQLIYIMYLQKYQPFDRRYLRLIINWAEVCQLFTYTSLIFLASKNEKLNSPQYLLNQILTFSIATQLLIYQVGIVGNFIAEMGIFLINLKNLVGSTQSILKKHPFKPFSFIIDEKT